MTQARKIINEINENGGFDLRYMRAAAKQDGVSFFEYVKTYIKSFENCHGNTARKVAEYFCYS